MGRQLSERQRGELEVLYQRATLTFEFIARDGSLGTYADGFRKAINDSFRRKNLSGLRMIVDDLKDFARSLSATERQELSRQLTELGVDTAQEDARLLKRVQRVVERGRIANEEEYRILLDRMEQIYHDPSAEPEVDRINALLATF